jgi:lysophospholipase L1-like esterase
MVILLLGTNELKHIYRLSPKEIAQRIAKLIEAIQKRKPQFRKKQPQILLISPPLVNEHTEYCMKEDKYKGATEKSRMLGEAYFRVSEKHDIDFLDTSQKVDVGEDGIHLSENGHKSMALFVTLVVSETFE